MSSWFRDRQNPSDESVSVLNGTQKYQTIMSDNIANFEISRVFLSPIFVQLRWSTEPPALRWVRAPPLRAQPPSPAAAGCEAPLANRQRTLRRVREQSSTQKKHKGNIFRQLREVPREHQAFLSPERGQRAAILERAGGSETYCYLLLSRTSRTVAAYAVPSPPDRVRLGNCRYYCR